MPSSGLLELQKRGFDILVKNHAQAILGTDFPSALGEVVDALLAFSIPVAELIASGGGEAKSTQRLRNSLYECGWSKHNFVFKKLIDGDERESISHEIDHVKSINGGKIALEIEWNNKDPFFDRDLENFQRLHAESVISVGIIVTRGLTLQQQMESLIRKCVIKHGIEKAADLERFGMKKRTDRQIQIVDSRMARKGISFLEVFPHAFVADKYGSATTHWEKLQARVDRGVGNPCPLLLVGLPSSVVEE